MIKGFPRKVKYFRNTGTYQKPKGRNPSPPPHPVKYNNNNEMIMIMIMMSLKKVPIHPQFD